MKQTDFAKHLTDFFCHYLPVECGFSSNTVKTYSYTFTLLLKYLQIEQHIRAEMVTLSVITKEIIIHFLDWVDKERKCCVSTRNSRLAAIHSFFRYLQYRNVEGLAKWQNIMSVKYKKAPSPEMAYLTIEGIKFLLKQPDLNTKYGRRDLALMGLLYDSGCRVQELIELTPQSLRFEETTTIILYGKGRKTRIVPLSDGQVRNLRKYMEEFRLNNPEYQNHPLFANHQGNKMSRMSVRNIIRKYVDMAKAKSPELFPEGISCHSLRHSKAVHMLEANINLVYIRDFLGHTSTTTTEIYAKASEKLKMEALSKLSSTIVVEGKTSWQKDSELLSYLKNLQRKY